MPIYLMAAEILDPRETGRRFAPPAGVDVDPHTPAVYDGPAAP